jgi:hypothetical protein
MRSIKTIIKSDLLICFLLGCATVYGCIAAGLTPAQRTLWSLDVYQQQYDEYLSMTINPNLDAETKAYLKANPADIKGEYLNPNLSDEAKKMLRVKKEILIQLKPLVLMAAEYHTTGKLPTEDVQLKIAELLNKLVEMEDK